MKAITANDSLDEAFKTQKIMNFDKCCNYNINKFMTHTLSPAANIDFFTGPGNVLLSFFYG